ncbi:MAG: 50S ribosomal protein L4, partial [Proteobacteria bacterium]
GTGRARQGSNRAPNHVGGGVVFGPQPRDYSYRLPRSQRRAALRAALSQRFTDRALLVIDQLSFERPSTKAAQGFFALTQAQSLLVVSENNEALKLSTRNLPKAKFVDAAAINVFDIIRHQKLAITKQALDTVIARAMAKPKAAPVAA